MNDLLPHYERELALLREQAAGFAQKYPKIAGRLQLSGDVGEDPHVERLIESFALLAARVHKRLDDDFPLFTESFLEVLYPHYLRPFPACAVARFDLGVSAGQLSKASTVPRGTYLASRSVRGVVCKFRTAYDVQLAPLRVSAASFRAGLQAPVGTAVPKSATSLLSVQLQLDSPQATWQSLGITTLRVALDGEASQVAALREALFGATVGVMLQTSPTGPWLSVSAVGSAVGSSVGSAVASSVASSVGSTASTSVPSDPAPAATALPQAVGFADEESLIDFDPRSDAAYRLLTEYMAFPDKFNFVD